MQYSLEQRTVSLSVGEFSDFALGPHDAAGGPQGLWRAQLGQHWHNELRHRTEREQTVNGTLRPDVLFEVPVSGCLVHRGWTFTLTGRIDQIVGPTLREIKTVSRPLPTEETVLRTDYPAYFLQLAAYVVLVKSAATSFQRSAPSDQSPALGSQLSTLSPRLSSPAAELVFVETSSGLAQTIALTPFDEALVSHQLDALVEFLNLQARAVSRRRTLAFRPPFADLRPGQETIQADLVSAFAQSQVVLFEAPTGYGKTGCVLEFALGQLRSGRFARLVWLTGKSTAQLQVMHTLRQMSPTPAGPATALPAWQVRNKGEHCVNPVFHCLRDACGYLDGCADRWPGSGLARFYLDDQHPRDLDTLRTAGRDARICPYEITRAALAFNDVWIGDYNYVFAPDNRGLFLDQPGFDPAETLLVIDEAHNLPSRVADAHSHTAHASDAQALLAELDHLRAPPSLILAIESWALVLGRLRPCDSLDPADEADLHDAIDRITRHVLEHPLDYAALGPRHAETLWQFPKLREFLADTALRRLVWCPRPGELALTCIDAADAIGATLRHYGGALLMSATLAPYGNTATACGLTHSPTGSGLRSAPSADEDTSLAPHSPPPARPYATLRAPAPWREGAYDVAVDLRIDTTFKQRANFYGTTAATIEALHAAASAQSSALSSSAGSSGCVVVFFPSYAYAETVQRTLEHNRSVLRVSLQPRLPDLAAQAAWVEETLVFADALFLVLGSSFAEGIDLLGGRISHAMVVGPALPEVNAVQKARSDAFVDLGREAAFRRVYQIPGLQKVNQALGRLVRAPGQRAKVLLHCRRFADSSYANLLAPEYQLYREIVTADDLAQWLA